MGHVQTMKGVLKCLFCIPVVLCVFYLISPSLRMLLGLLPMDKCTLESSKMLVFDNSVDSSLDLCVMVHKENNVEALWHDESHLNKYMWIHKPSRVLSPEYCWDTSIGYRRDIQVTRLLSRSDVQTCTSWNAPIIWEGMFDPDLYDEVHKKEGSSVALTVFAVGRYLDAYLMTFLNSSEHHFMLGLPVTYYVFTDVPEKVPDIKLAPQRSIKVIKVEKNSRWQDISMMRMKAISDAIGSDIRHRCSHVFCFDVDQVFTGRFGSEALGESVALLHAHYYHLPKSLFTYDRNPKSQAYMQTGDFYYHAAIFGGSWKSVKALTDACYQSIMEDKENNVEALWHDESHLNKYMWIHKPSRVLSPEYCWDTSIDYRRDIQVTRLLWAPKYYDTLRTP